MASNVDGDSQRAPEDTLRRRTSTVSEQHDVTTVEAPISALAELAQVPVCFLVDRVFDVGDTDGTVVLAERRIDHPYVKDYDALGESPVALSARFDVSKWGHIQARANAQLVGGAVIAFATPDVDLLEGRRDLAVLWDLRVAPDVRRRRIGSALFDAAERWAAARGCRHLTIETQNVNVPACRFYARHGCAVRAVRRRAYPRLAGEIQLLWSKELFPTSPDRP
jgi:ribosomal protein S18 acetylase RimI-like enzyme